MKNNYEGVNWSQNSEMVETFWQQQWKQMWHPEEVAVSNDIKQWKEFEFQIPYIHALGGLTLLDTIQTNVGMNKIAEYETDMRYQALFTVFGAFEAIHAKSYSYIFTTLCTKAQIDEVFDWVKNNPYLQYKASKIADVYKSIDKNDLKTLWKAKFASVMLESFLFYSGFFYPLYLGGQGILRNSSEVISLILRDESIHGVATGFSAQQDLTKFDKQTQNELIAWGNMFLSDLYLNEIKYTDDVYAETGLAGKVKAYVRYNANKALMNLGLPTMFDEEDIDPIVMNGIRNKGTTYDFFSQKGATYTIATVKPITDKTFDFSNILLENLNK